MSRFIEETKFDIYGYPYKVTKQLLGTLRHPPISDLVLHLRNKYNISTLIETGTFLGKSTSWAAQHFKNVITMEIHVLFKFEAVQNCRDFDNIEFLLVDSREGLSLLVPKQKEPALFWLDAHGLNVFRCTNPIMTELEMICRSPTKHFILIDDAHFYIDPDPEEIDLIQINNKITGYGYKMWKAHDVLVVACSSAAEDIESHGWVPYE